MIGGSVIGTRLVVLLSVMAIAFAACTDSASPSPRAGTPTPSPTAAPTPTPETVSLTGSTYGSRMLAGRDGGQLVVGDWQESTQFNPYYVRQVTEANVASAVWATVFVYTDDFRYAPDLASDIPTLANGGVVVPGIGGDAMTVTWTLKPGLTWSDGQPLTCDDFKFAWQWVLDPDNVGVVTTGWNLITNFECASPTSMVLHFKDVYEGYISMLTAPLPRHYLSRIPMADQVKGVGFRPADIVNVPVSGAFKFASVTPTKDLRLVRNAQYKSFSTGKPAHLDALTFRWYRDADSMIAGFAAGEIDVAAGLQDWDIPKLAARGLTPETSSIPALLYEFLRLNWSAGPFITTGPNANTGGCSRNPVVQDRGIGCPMADPAMRAAIPFAIDKNAITTQLLNNAFQVANTSVSPKAWFFADQTPTPFDPVRANGILDAAGWVRGPDGIRSKGGLRAKIELCTTNRQIRIDTLGLITNWLRAIGIEAITNAASASDIFADYTTATNSTPCALSRSNFDIAEHAFSSSIDPLGNYFNYHSDAFEPKGVNAAQVSDPAIDAALNTVRTSVDFVAVKQAMADFQKLYVEKTVEVPLYYRRQVDLFGPKVGNFVGNPTKAGPTWNAVDWFAKS